MQQLSREQSGQAAVALEQLLMQTPAQRTSDLLLCKHQSGQQFWKLVRIQRREQRWTEKKRIREAENATPSCPDQLRIFTPLLSSTRFSPLEMIISRVSSRWSIRASNTSTKRRATALASVVPVKGAGLQHVYSYSMKETPQ